MFEQLYSEGVVLVESKPNWVNDGFCGEEAIAYIEPLMKFFVIETPVTNLSARSISIETYGWEEPWKKPVWLNRQVKDLSSNSKLYYSSDAHGGMEPALNKCGLLNFDWNRDLVEVACFYNSEKNQTLSLFKHIRNSICHGRFSVFTNGGDVWVAMEDVTNRRKNDPIRDCSRLTARLLLKHSTISAWEKLIVQGNEHA